MWIIQKRVANTEHWGTVARARTEEEARARALGVEGGRSTGVRILPDDDPWRVPEIVVGR